MLPIDSTRKSNWRGLEHSWHRDQPKYIYVTLGLGSSAGKKKIELDQMKEPAKQHLLLFGNIKQEQLKRTKYVLFFIDIMVYLTQFLALLSAWELAESSICNKHVSDTFPAMYSAGSAW